MEYGAIDLHLRDSVIRLVDETGAVVQQRRVSTTREALVSVFGGRAPMRVLVDSGTESEWVAQTVEGCGHTVGVADPNDGLMYGHRPRGVKTDARDVAALSEACRLGIYRRAHRVSAAQRQRRREPRVREQLIRLRTPVINLLRAQLRQEGYRWPAVGRGRGAPGGAGGAAAAAAGRAAPAGGDAGGAGAAAGDGDDGARDGGAGRYVVQRLMTAPGVGPITALTYRAVLDDVGRFADARGVSAFLGLVPREASSGTRHRKGSITKAGPGTLRVLLIQAGWVIWRGRGGSAALHAWVHRLAERRGKRIAIVALARRLGRILSAMWRDATNYRVAAVRPAA